MSDACPPRVVLIDNYDCFTYNLVQYLGELGAEVLVHRHDAIDVAGHRRAAARRTWWSRPGPKTPDEAGISVEAIRELAGTVPILGVCLGHQAIGQAFGGTVVRGREPVHGKTSRDPPRRAHGVRGTRQPDGRHALPLAGGRPGPRARTWSAPPGATATW